RDRHGLALAARERGDHVAHAGNTRGKLVEERPGLHFHRDLVEPVRAQLAAEENVRHDVEVLAQREVLEHRRYPQVERRARIGKVHRLAAEHDRSGARLMHARKNLHERRFARAVVADEGDYLARMHVELDIRESRNRTEVLRDAAQAQHPLAARAACRGAVRRFVSHEMGTSSLLSGPGARRARPCASAADAELLAALGVTPRAQVRCFREALVHHLGLDVLLRDDGRLEELRGRLEERRLALHGLAVEKAHGHLRRRARHDLAGLEDRVVLVARDDQLQARGGRVVTRDRRNRIDARRLEGRDRAACRAVVGGHHAHDLRPEAGDLPAHPLLRLGRRPLRRVVLGERLVAAALQPFVNALLDEPRGGVSRRAVHFEHATLAPGNARLLQ
ncbi:hypothetical protein NECAME_18964, partial [Necator americanus]